MKDGNGRRERKVGRKGKRKKKNQGDSERKGEREREKITIELMPWGDYCQVMVKIGYCYIKDSEGEDEDFFFPSSTTTSINI